jgi:hypothetical protein
MESPHALGLEITVLIARTSLIEPRSMRFLGTAQTIVERQYFVCSGYTQALPTRCDFTGALSKAGNYGESSPKVVGTSSETVG